MTMAEIASVAVRLLVGCLLLWRVPRVTASAARRPAVAVVVPARDEEASLPALLASLRPQLGPADELVVVDDHSTDRTAEVAAGGGATVVAGRPLPAGWTGKAWALHQGVAATAAPGIVVLDADVVLEPDALDGLVGARDASGGLISVAPVHVVVRPYERLSAVVATVAMMGTGAFTPVPTRRPSGAFGPCMVTSRADLQAVGGYEAVAGDVLDDVALARRYVAAGLPVTLLGGRGVARYRMYPEGLRHLVDGWSKNIAAGAGRTRWYVLVLVVAWVSLLLQAPWYGPAVYAACVAQLAWMWSRIGRFGFVTAVLFPLPLLAFVAIFLRSAYLTVIRRQVPWKGRQVRLGA
jgi:4,4'-diaponeurosporenoate glycosyltransferase